VDATIIKNKYLQIDLVRKTSGMLKIAACMDEANVDRINDLVYRLDHLTVDLEAGILDGAQQAPLTSKPVLKLV